MDTYFNNESNNKVLYDLRFRTRKKALLMGGSVIALLALVTAGALVWYYTSHTSSPYKTPKYVSESSLGVYTKVITFNSIFLTFIDRIRF